VTTQKARLMLCTAALAILAVASAAAPAAATWSIVWADEFNGTSLDAANWAPDIGTGCPNLCGWGNNELQYYRSENVTVTGGNLVLTARAESYGGASYTSGKVTTRGKRSFLYGRIEMRAKIPTGGGMWPAFWMMPQADVYGGWAASGEIDIMESANGTTAVGGALHFGGVYPANTSTSSSYTLGGANFADAFHVYAVEWEPDTIRWYVDGVLFMTRTSAQWYSSTAPAPAASLPAGDITITATAGDTDGTITTVEFSNGATVLGADTSAPYSFTWTSVPSGCYTVTVRALDNLGGSGVAYLDADAGNSGGQYRPTEGVDIESCADTGGGYNVGWTNAGEWIEYTVAVPAAGGYTIRARVSSLLGGGHFRLEFNGVDRTGDITVPNTTGWQTWTTVSATAFLPAGTQVMRFVPTVAGFNVNWFEILSGASAVQTDLRPAGYALHPCYPNPFNPITTISYDLPEPAAVHLTIHDLAGRLVRTLAAEGVVGEGRHEVVWNGRDEAGQVMAAGVYFYRLDAAGFTETRRMTLLK